VSDEAGKALALQVDATNRSDGMVFARNSHPDAQWFPDAGLGLFVHWGIHSVAGIQPSWAMVKDYPYGYEPEYSPFDRYIRLAERFDPQAYDPDRWIGEAAAAGCRYAVLTAKHHDGFALWPSAYGRYSTRNHLGGRDLLEPYVEACRKHGLKVGLYFSPRDWSYPGYPLDFLDFDASRPRPEHEEIADPAANLRAFEQFYAHTLGQIRELLTRYGQVDVLWFDGIDWPGIEDFHTAETLDAIRDLQPGILVNDRWRRTGDFETPECHLPAGRPKGWWEACDIWPYGHWGYVPSEEFKPLSWFFERLTRCRAWGGNFLFNVGPRPDGTMPEPYGRLLGEVAEWMSHSGESLLQAGETPDDIKANRLLTRRDDLLYVHSLSGDAGAVHVEGISEPRAVIHLRTGASPRWTWSEGILQVFPEFSCDRFYDEVLRIDLRPPLWSDLQEKS